MKPIYETILALPDQSFSAVNQIGKVIDCEYHVHPEYELVCIHSSFGTRMINDDISQFDAGSIHLIAPLLPHHYFNSPADSQGADWAKISVIQFRPDFAGLNFFRLPEMALVARLLQDACHGLEFTGKNPQSVLLLADELCRSGGARRLVLLLELLDILSRQPYRKLSSHCLPERPVDGDIRINRALRFIHARLEHGISPALSEVATHIGMGTEGFSRYFARMTGHLFIDYMVELKLGKAANLLIHTDVQITEICYRSGFKNLSNFNRHFLKSRGVTPGAFRRLARHNSCE